MFQPCTPHNGLEAALASAINRAMTNGDATNFNPQTPDRNPQASQSSEDTPPVPCRRRIAEGVPASPRNSDDESTHSSPLARARRRRPIGAYHEGLGKIIVPSTSDQDYPELSPPPRNAPQSKENGSELLEQATCSNSDDIIESDNEPAGASPAQPSENPSEPGPRSKTKRTPTYKVMSLYDDEEPFEGRVPNARAKSAPLPPERTPDETRDSVRSEERNLRSSEPPQPRKKPIGTRTSRGTAWVEEESDDEVATAGPSKPRTKASGKRHPKSRQVQEIENGTRKGGEQSKSGGAKEKGKAPASKSSGPRTSAVGGNEKTSEGRRSSKGKKRISVSTESEEGDIPMDPESLTSAPIPVVHPSEKYYGGLCLVNVVLPRGGGNGVEIRVYEAGRELIDKHVNELADVAGPTLEGLLTREAVHAIVLALPRGSFDPTSLTLDPKEAVPIRWKEAAKGKIGILFNGNHRRAALIKVNEPRLRIIRDYTLKVESHKERNEPERAAEVRKEKDEFIRKCEPHFMWLARVYDLTGIEEDKERASIEMKLASNNAVSTLPESEPDALDAIMRHLAHAQDEDARSTTIREATSLLGNSYPHIGQLLRRGLPLISFIVSLRQHKSFLSFPVRPNVLADFNLSSWGLLEPVLEGCKEELVFLSTELSLPPEVLGNRNVDLKADTVVLAIRNALSSSLQSYSHEQFPISERVFECLVNASEKLFGELNLGNTDLGTASQAYGNAMQSYFEGLSGEVERQISESREEDADKWNDLDDRVARLLPLKLKVLAGSTHLENAGRIPRLPGRLPILCPSALETFINNWVPLGKVLYMIANWFVPGIRHVGTQLKGHNSKETSNPAFLNYPAGIKLSLAYWVGCHTELPDGMSWKRLSAEEVGALPIGSTSACYRDSVRQAFDSLTLRLFKYKYILHDLERVLPFITPPEAYNSKKKLNPPDPIVERLRKHAGPMLETWITHITESHKARTSSELTLQNVKPRYAPDAPREVTRYVRDNNGGDALLTSILRMLEFCPFNFLIPSQPNNRSHLHFAVSKQLWLENEFYQTSLIPATDQYDQVRWLFYKIIHDIQKIPGFEGFKLWPNFPKPVHDNLQPIEDDSASKEREERIDRRSESFDKAIRNFIRAVGHPDCLGIPMEGSKKAVTVKGHGLHPVLGDMLVEMHKRAQELFEDLETIQEDEELTEWPSPPQVSMGVDDYWGSVELKVPVAKRSDLERHYRVEDVKEAKARAGEKRKRGGDSDDSEESDDEDVSPSPPAKRARSIPTQVVDSD
ncbi:hypothetical protein NMY22_g17658 [Coprinellus aureogranulatus]|nr:hypothetical protein NMY22_g17658 [Coprinellus aureogranulatus]